MDSFHSLWGQTLRGVHPISHWSTMNTLWLFQRNHTVFYMNSACLKGQTFWLGKEKTQLEPQLDDLDGCF